MRKSSLPNKEQLTPAEFSRLQQDALDVYNAAVWNLADIILLGKNKFGRTNLMALTPMTLTKVQWLAGIAGLSNRNANLLPEHHAEVIGRKDAAKWLRVAVKEKLNPLKLRQRIRKHEGNFKSTPKLTGVCDYPRLLDQVERELKRLAPEERERARQYVASRTEKLF